MLGNQGTTQRKYSLKMHGRKKKEEKTNDCLGIKEVE